MARRGALRRRAPNIWRFEDTDDDGVADKREIIVSAFGYTGNAADIHGCFLGPEAMAKVAVPMTRSSA